MRTRVRAILTFWLMIAGSIAGSVAYAFLPADLWFWVVLALLVLEMGAAFAIWRTQPTFRKLMHWLSGGLWPRKGVPT